jgi:hypothetical protein
MSKTILYKWFGLGKIPKRMRPVIEQEGTVLIDEGIGGWIKFKNFRAPGRRYSLKYSWFTGAIVLTHKRFAAFTFYPFFNPIINLPLDVEQLNKLQCSLKEETTLCVLFDPSDFNDNWSGSIECRFSTDQARLFLERLRGKQARGRKT